VIAYREKLDENLFLLQKQILTRNIEVGNYHFFTIYDPKERQICAASFSERVLHHALMNVCHSIFENQQIFHSYATRKDKGTYAALDRAVFFHNKSAFFLKLDIRKYFDSIDHAVLFSLLQRKIKDPEVLCIFKQIIESYHTQKGKGLPIGNLTSQYFANYYLSFTDRYIKEDLQIKSYVRYMDDMVLWHSNKEYLLEIGARITTFLNAKLTLELKIKQLNRTDKGLTFLGYRLFQGKIKLSPRSKKRFVMKVKECKKKLENNEWTQSEYQQHILPLLAFVKYAETKELRKKIFKEKG